MNGQSGIDILNFLEHITYFNAKERTNPDYFTLLSELEFDLKLANGQFFYSQHANFAVGFGVAIHFSSIENLIGYKNNDSLTGDGNANRLEGRLGNDQLKGGDGNDVLIGGVGRDSLYGEAGDDFLIGNPGADTFVYIAGYDNDTISDFQNDMDHLDLRSFGFATAAQALQNATDNPSGVVFDFGSGDTLMVMGQITKAQLADDLLV